MATRKEWRGQRGFTLIELMIVIVIMGILATLLIPRIMDRPEEARRLKAKMDIKNIESALKLYKIDSGSYPTTEQGIEALIKKPETAPVPAKWREGGYLDGNSVPKDPWGHTYYYFSPAQDGKDYEIVSYGSDGEPGGTAKMRIPRAAISLKNRGFTLLELLIVILVIGIFITFASVNWNVFEKKGKEALLESFSIDIAMIREQAVSDYENRVIEFDVGSGKIRVGSKDVKNTFVEASDVDLSEEFRIKDVVVNGQPCPTGKCYMTFRADGTVDRVILHLEGRDRNDLYSMLINPLTARVTGENGYTQEISFTDRNNPS